MILLALSGRNLTGFEQAALHMQACTTCSMALSTARFSFEPGECKHLTLDASWKIPKEVFVICQLLEVADGHRLKPAQYGEWDGPQSRDPHQWEASLQKVQQLVRVQDGNARQECSACCLQNFLVRLKPDEWAVGQVLAILQSCSSQIMLIQLSSGAGPVLYCLHCHHADKEQPQGKRCRLLCFSPEAQGLQSLARSDPAGGYVLHGIPINANSIQC